MIPEHILNIFELQYLNCGTFTLSFPRFLVCLLLSRFSRSAIILSQYCFSSSPRKMMHNVMQVPGVMNSEVLTTHCTCIKDIKPNCFNFHKNFHCVDKTAMHINVLPLPPKSHYPSGSHHASHF